MSKQIVEVVYGKHQRYEVIRLTSLFEVRYVVRTPDGRSHGSFERLDRAVERAQTLAGH